MAYRADIEIAVKGAQELKRLSDQVSATSKLVDGLNNYLENIGSGGVTRNIDNLRNTLSNLSTVFNTVALDTKEAETVARQYLQATEALNAGLSQQATILRTIKEENRAAKLSAAGITEKTQYAGPIGPGAASSVALSSPLRNRLQQLIDEKKGAKELSAALLELENRRRAETNALLDAKAVAVQKKFLAGETNQYAGPIGPGPASPVALSTQLRGRTQQILEALAAEAAAAAETAAQTAKLSERQKEFTARTEEAARAAKALTAEFIRQQREKLQLQKGAPASTVEFGPGGPGFSGGFTASQRQLANEQAILRTREVENKARRETLQIITREELFELKLQKILERNAQLAEQRSVAGFGKLAKKGISSAAIGGAFPLLFGQTGAAATGGAIGGLLGEAIPGVGGFGGSLIGTLIGEKIGQGNKVKELAADIGFSAEQTKLLGIAFQQAGRDFDKFQQSVQNIRGLSLSINDQAKAIQLVSALTENYGGQIDKVTNALTSSLESGKVSQATLNQLTSQGIPIQQALADKYKISRDAVLQYAKDGKISVQDLINTLVDVGNKGSSSAKTQKDAFNDSFNQINLAVKEFQTTVSASFKQTAEALRVDLGGAIQAVTSYLVDLVNGFSALAKVASILDPIISAYINLEKAIFNAVKAVPALRDAIVSFALTALGPLQGVVVLLNQIRGIGAATKGKEKQGPYLPERLTRKPLQSFIAPSQFVSSGGGSSGEADKAAKATEREAARVANIVRDRAVETEQLKLQQQYAYSIFVAEVDKNNVLKIQLQYAQKYGEISLDYSKQINDEVAKGNSSAVKAAITQTYLTKLKTEQLNESIALKQEEFKQQENYQNMLLNLQEELDLRSAATEETRQQIRLQYELERLKRGGTFTETQLAEISMRKKQINAPKTPAELITGQIGTIQEGINNLVNAGNQAITIASGIGDAFGTSFKGIIDGSQTAQQALAGFFQSVANSFLDMAAKIIAEWIKMTILNSILSIFPGFGNAGKGLSNLNAPVSINNPLGNLGSIGGSYRAAGGPVSANTPYIVGEKGPELFMPRNSGTIIPNNAMGGGSTNVVVNVDASGSNVQGDQPQAKQLGLAVSAAVQAELVKQQRPGGLLYSR